MRARFRQFLENLRNSFWLIPSLCVAVGIAGAESLINAERFSLIPEGFLTDWLYSGGETGARTLLGAVAASTIGVAGTVFSITIATLTLASSQMGPRLLSNFTRDRGNQITLGIFLGTFVYALLTLRSVRGAEQGAFVPHLAITGAALLALLCVAMLIYFVNHAANRINFDTVITLVTRDLRHSIAALAQDQTAAPQPPDFWKGAQPLALDLQGYIQQLDDSAVVAWARQHKAAVRLDARIGNFVFPGSPFAAIQPPTKGAGDMLRRALVTGSEPTASGDIEYGVGQLVDIAVRALSSGVNDPRTAVRVLDRLGAVLCHLSKVSLPTGVFTQDGQVIYQRQTTTYDGLLDAMFHVIRQSAKGAPMVLIHLAAILRHVAQCETDPARRHGLRRHAQLLKEDGESDIANQGDRETFRKGIAQLEAELSS